MIRDRLLRALFRRPDPGTWVSEGVLGCAYPRTERALERLSRRGVRVLVNLHRRPQDPRRLVRHGMREFHLPVADFQAPSPGQIRRGLGAIAEARTAGEAVAVHCGGGLGRTGTLLACYLLSEEALDAGEAIGRVRSLRPGSVETRAQVTAVEAWSQDHRLPASSYKQGSTNR